MKKKEDRASLLFRIMDEKIYLKTEISIIIPCRNEEKFIEKCLDFLFPIIYNNCIL